MGFFLDSYVNSVILNSELIECFNNIRSFHHIDGIYNTTQQMLNYLIKYKYNNNSTENIYYYLKALSQLSSLPVFSLEKNALESIQTEEMTINVVNALGHPLKNNYTVNYLILSEKTNEKVKEGIAKGDNTDKL